MATREEMLAQALQHHRAGRLAEADLFYRQILHDWPTSAEALHLFGVLLAQLKQHEAAAQLIGRAIELKPRQGDFHASYGNVLYLQGKLREGADSYKLAMFHSYIKHMPFGFDEILERASKPFREFNVAGADTDIGAYKSQTLQDLFLDRWVFRGFRDGCFIDIGAHDGITLSNTWFFEKTRAWNGVCVEPNPVVFKRLAANRRCKALNCCISDKPETVEFRKITGYSEMLSGIAAKYDLLHRKRIEDELKEHGGSSEIIEMRARTFGDIAAESGLSEITYVSIDTEGGELAILQSIDFERIFVHALTVECNLNRPEPMISVMRESNFELIKSLGPDLLFLNRGSPFFAPYDQLRNA